jgi:hypothetical protein
MRGSVLVVYILATLGTLAPSSARATCGEDWDGQYSSDIDDCRSQFGDDPADADDLASCIQEAKDDYRSCLDDCVSAANSLPPRWSLVGSPLTAPVRSTWRADRQPVPRAGRNRLFQR